MELGLHVPYKSGKVSKLKKFKYENATSHILQQVRKVPTAGHNLLYVTTNNTITEDSIQCPLSIESIGTSFTITTYQSLKKLYHQNQEKDVKIREIEEKIQQVRLDEGNLQEFKSCVQKVRT